MSRIVSLRTSFALLPNSIDLDLDLERERETECSVGELAKHYTCRDRAHQGKTSETNRANFERANFSRELEKKSNNN